LKLIHILLFITPVRGWVNIQQINRMSSIQEISRARLNGSTAERMMRKRWSINNARSEEDRAQHNAAIIAQTGIVALGLSQPPLVRPVSAKDRLRYLRRKARLILRKARDNKFK